MTLQWILTVLCGVINMGLGIKSVDTNEADYEKYSNTRKTHSLINIFAGVLCFWNLIFDVTILKEDSSSIVTNVWNYIYIIASITVVLGLFITQKILYNIIKRNDDNEFKETDRLYKVYHSKIEIWTDVFLSVVILLLAVYKIVDILM